MLEYIRDNSDKIISQIQAHLMISIAAVAVAILIGIPLGYLASKSKLAEKLVSAPFQVLRVVPSLALLALLIPVMGTGVPPAVVALSVLAIPPVLLNTIVGFREVPDFLVESARGIGLTDQEILYKVRFPSALPMILAGVRTSLVEAVASATLASKIGAGGLGDIIFTGLGLNRSDLLLIGGVLVALLSLGSGFVLYVITRWILRYKYI